jgi:hypothetical protein
MWGANRSFVARRVHNSAQTEISNLNLPCMRAYEDIVTFNVSVNYGVGFPGVQVAQSLEDIPAPLLD